MRAIFAILRENKINNAKIRKKYAKALVLFEKAWYDKNTKELR